MVHKPRATRPLAAGPTRGTRTVTALVVTGALALAARGAGLSPAGVFALAALSLVPASKLLGDATEDLAVHAGPRIGGLLNATLGSAALVIIAGLALREGLFELVKASITGAIIAHLLVVLGLSAFLGGLRHGRQYFDRVPAGMSATMMILSVVALTVPALYGQLVPMRNAGSVESLSEAVAAVMIAVYLLSIYYSLFWNIDEQAIAGVHQLAPRWSARRSVLALLSALAAITVLAQILVGTVTQVVATTRVTEFFLGIVVIPLVGSVSEHLLAVETAWRNRMDVTMAIAMGSSMHVALFAAPLLVFASLVVGHPMDLIFNQLELVALGAAALVTTLVAMDGESNWLEGVMLLAVYLILGLAFFWWPREAIEAAGTGHAGGAPVLLGVLFAPRP